MSRLVFARIALELVFSKLYSGIYDLYSLFSFCSWQPDLDKRFVRKYLYCLLCFFFSFRDQNIKYHQLSSMYHLFQTCMYACFVMIEPKGALFSVNETVINLNVFEFVV